MRKIFLMLSAAVLAHASIIYSTDATASPGFTTGAGFGGPGQPPNVGMRFVASASGTVSEYTVPLSAFSNTLVSFELLSDVADSPGLVLDSFAFNVSTAAALLTAASSSHPVLNAQTAYWLISDWTNQQTVLWYATSPAVNGTVWANSVGVADQERLAAFAVQGATAVPEPAGDALVSAGIICLLVCATKFRTVLNRRR